MNTEDDRQLKDFPVPAVRPPPGPGGRLDGGPAWHL